MKITKVRDELRSIEAIAELEPGATYVFKLKGDYPLERLEEFRKHFELYLDRFGIHAILVPDDITAIYKVERFV